MGDQAYKVGWVEISLAVIALLVLLAAGVRGCKAEDPQPIHVVTPPPLTGTPTPAPSPPETTAKAHQTATLTIRRIYPTPAVGAPVTGISPSPFGEDITLTLTQDAEVKAPIIVVTPQPYVTYPPFSPAPRPEIDHSRIGVVVGTFPGMLAVDVQVVRTKPFKLLGSFVPKAVGETEMSVDVEANHLQAGAMVAAGDKVFFGAGYYGSWATWTQGPMIGAGMRF